MRPDDPAPRACAAATVDTGKGRRRNGGQIIVGEPGLAWYEDHRGWVRVAVVAGALVIAAHGLVHLMGVALLWKLAEPGQLRYADAEPAPGSTAGYLVGSLWLAVALLFVIAAFLLAARRA